MGKTLRVLRRTKDWTQAEAAEKLGISTFTLSNYERCKSYPDVPVIEKITAVYGVGYDEIIFLPQNVSSTDN